MILEAIILAAGEGVRMRSTLPKALHNVGGRPMLARVIEAANALKPAPAKIHVVAGDHLEAMRAAVERDRADYPADLADPRRPPRQPQLGHPEKTPRHRTRRHAGDAGGG